MRASILVLASLVPLAACTTQVTGGFGGLGGDTGVTTWLPTTTSPSSSSSSTSSSTSSGAGACSDPTPVGIPASPCTPNAPYCAQADSACLATKHAHGGPIFDLRLAQITLTTPVPLTQGIVGEVFRGAVPPNLGAPCYLNGGGTFNVLLHVDALQHRVTVGGARPAATPSSGYSFLHEVMTLEGNAIAVEPALVAPNTDPTCGLDTPGVDVKLPFFADTSGASLYTIFPLRSLRFHDAKLSPDHDCIGAFNTALDPYNGCMPDQAHRPFVDGGQLDAYIDLEEADSIFVPVINQSLCVLVAGDSLQWGNGQSPAKCRRDASGAIAFQGDWCGATNGPATAGCADAVRFAGSFAASGTSIH